MAPKNSDELVSMLNRLASAKSLDKAPPATTAQAVQRNAQLRLRDYTIESLTTAPNLRDRINQIASGEVGGVGNPNLLQKVLGNTAVRTALFPLAVIDTPRRAIISGVREIADALDSDPATRASFGDFINQAKDPAYGFGTAFPMQGWAGRIVGFAGDVLLDPITYATIGGTVPAKAFLRGTDIATREALGGVKYVAGRSGREALARLADKRMVAQEFIEGGVKRTPEEIAAVVQRVAREGKKALPDDIARDIGIPKPGIYYFGSRVRVPGTGLLGSLIERGIVKTRLGITSTRVGQAIQKAITPTGAPGAALDALSVRDMRVALQQGKVDATTARSYLQLLKADEDRRIAMNFALQQADQELRPLFDDPDLRTFNLTVHELMEGTSPERLASAPAAERRLAERLRAQFELFHARVTEGMKQIDPDFKLGKIEDYFPHMLSEAGIKHIRDATNPYVESILKFIKMDVGDPANSFKSRNIRAGQEFFGVKLEPKDLTARRLNEIARPKLGFDLFETDMTRVLAKYAQNYAEQMGTARFMQIVQSNPEMLRTILTKIDIDADAVKAFDEDFAAAMAEMDKTTNAVGKSTDRLKKRLDKVVEELESRAKKNLVVADDSAVLYESIQAAAQELSEALSSLNTARYALGNRLYSANEVVEQFQKQYDDIERRVKELDLEIVSAFGRAEGPVADQFSQLGESVVANMDRQNLTDRVTRLRALQTKIDSIEKDSRRLASEWESVAAFHNNLSDMQAHFDSAAFGIDTDFSDRLLDVVETPKSLRDGAPRVVTKSGKIQDEHIRQWWSNRRAETGPAARVKALFPDERESSVIAQIQLLLDPKNVISQAALRNLTIENVRTILARGTTSADNLAELHLALTWLVLRNIKHNPDLAVSILFDRATPVQMLPDNLNRILQLHEKVVNVSEVVEASRKAARGDLLTGPEQLHQNLLEAQSLYRDYTNQIADVKSQLANLLPAEERPLNSIYDNFVVGRYQREVNGGSANLLTNEEIDGIVEALSRHESGVDYAQAIETMREAPNNYSNVLSILEYAANEESRLAVVTNSKLGNKNLGDSLKELSDRLKELEGLQKAARKSEVDAQAALGDATRIQANAIANDPQSYLDLTREYSEEVLNYYIINESNLHFARVQKVWEPSGIIVGPDVYFRIRSDVAAVQARAMSSFIDEFNVVIGYFQELQRAVQALPAGEQGEALLALMSRLVADPDKGKLVNKYFPDFRLAVRQKATNEYDRLLNQDEEYKIIIDEVRQTLAALDVRAQTGKPQQRVVGNLTGRQTGSRLDPNALAETAEDFTSAPTTLPSGATRSIEAQVADNLRKVGSRNFMSTYEEIIELLDEGWVPKYRIVEGAIPVPMEPGVGFASEALDSATVLRARMNELRNRYETVVERVRKQRSEARAAAKAAGLPTGARASRGQLLGRAATEGYGLTGALVRALRNTRTSVDVRAFFADLVGNSSKFVDMPTIQVPGRMNLKYFDFADSYAGKTLDIAQRRRSALYNLADPDLRVDISSGVVPGLGIEGRGMDIWGPRALADAYEERAKQLRLSLADDEVYRKAAKEAGIEAQKALDGDLTLDEMRAIAERLEVIYARPAGRGTAENVPGLAQMWRFSSADSKLIDTIPEPLRSQIYEYRRLRLDAEQLRDSDIAQWAFQEKEFVNVIKILSTLDGWKLVNGAGEAAFDPFSVFGKRVWNEARPGMVDANGNPITSNVDTAWLDSYFSTLEPRYLDLGDGSPLQIDPRTVRREPRGLNHEAFAMREVRFEPVASQANRGDVYIDAGGRVLPFESAVELYSRGVPITALRPIALNGEKGVDRSAILLSARIGSGVEYDPTNLWIRMPAETNEFSASRQMGEPVQVLVPEVFMRHPRQDLLTPGPSPYAFKYQGRPLTFTEEEWMSLFIPAQINDVTIIRQQETKLAELNAELVELTSSNNYTTRRQNAISKKILEKTEQMQRNPNEAVRLQKEINSLKKEFDGLKKNAKKVSDLNKQIDAIKSDIDARMNRPIDTKSAAQLQREVNDLRKQLPTVRRQLTKAEQSRVARINMAIADREKQLSVVRARQSAEKKVRAIIEQVQDPRIKEALLFNKKPTDDVAKLVEHLVKRLQRGTTQDGLTVSVSGDVATARRAVIKSRFDSSDAGITVSKIQQADQAVHDSLFSAYMRDTRLKVDNATKLMENAQLLDDRATTWSRTASIIDSVRDVTARARKQVEGIQEPVLPGAGATPEQLAAVPRQLEESAWELRNRPPGRAMEPIQGGVEKRQAEFEQKFGANAKMTEEYKEMYDVLTLEKEAFDNLQRAMKTVADVLAGPEAKRVEQAAAAWNLAKANYDLLNYSYSFSQQSIAQTKANFERIVALANKSKSMQKGAQDAPSWANEVLLFAEEVRPWLDALGTEKMTREMQTVVSQYVEQVSTYYAQASKLTELQRERQILKGVMQMVEAIKAGDPEGVMAERLANEISSLPARVKGSVVIIRQADQGFVALGDRFPNLQINENIAELFQNVHRAREPESVRVLSNWLGSYTKFFKSYATLSPGFHIRNAISNGMMLFLGGARASNLLEALEVSRKWQKAADEGMDWMTFVRTLPADQQEAAQVARLSTAASGGGVFSDTFKEIRTDSKWYNNRLTQASKRFGQWSDDHSRFLFGYDAGKQGMDYSTAAARTRRFFVDYEDVSNLDKSLRQIIPFWMWTSRNLPTQIQNMWLNPKPYQIYFSIKRNLGDEDENQNDIVPQYLKQMGAFKLPFGKDLYANPDFGFNRIQQQLDELADPQRFLANVNPLIRLPIELAGGRQMYSNREFSQVPVEVEGGLSSVVQPLLQSVGLGQTSSTGKKFVNDKAYYALRNLMPFLGTAERLTPSVATYRDRGNTNAWLGFTGLPVREVTPEMRASELDRRRRLLAQLQAINNAVEGTDEQ